MALVQNLSASASHEAQVVFENTRGVTVEASVLRLHRDLAVFEMCDQDTVLHTSEVLKDFMIRAGEQVLYAGPALVRKLVSTGLTEICEASLDEAGFGSGANGTPRSSCLEFLRNWERFLLVSPEYKVALADLQNFLTSLKSWCDQQELRSGSPMTGNGEISQRALASHVRKEVLAILGNLFDRYERVASKIPKEQTACHYEFAKRQIHPLLFCSPFVYRTFRKPLGYAGDYEMVNMMFRDPGEGSSLFARLVNTYALGLPPIVGHRQRIAYLSEKLEQETLGALRRGGSARIFNLGCGPAQEIQNFLQHSVVADHTEITLVDFNDETLEYAGKVLEDLRSKHARKATLRLQKKSVQQLIKESGRARQPASTGAYDFVYCAGLFDYLTDKVCRQLIAVLHGMVTPGGLLLVTNVDEHSARGQMECFLEWNLVYRNAQQLRELIPERTSSESVSIIGDADAGVNVFLEIRKPEHA